jgi:transposase
VHAILARNLAPTPPVSDLFGKTGRHWLSRQQLPVDERSTVAALLRQLDFHGDELAIVDKELAREALSDPAVAPLMTIPGVDAIAGISIVAAIGDFSRFDDPNKLVAYVGLNPRVRQSGNSAPVHGRISKAGRAHVRGVLVEAAWSASRAPGPLRAFYQRVKARRGFQKAVVATARKMTVLAWHLVTRDQDYAFARPALVTHKRRKLELAAGAPSRRGNYRVRGAAYNDKQRRNEEKLAVERAEHAYEVLVARWQPKRPTPA